MQNEWNGHTQKQRLVRVESHQGWLCAGQSQCLPNNVAWHNLIVRPRRSSKYLHSLAPWIVNVHGKVAAHNFLKAKLFQLKQHHYIISNHLLYPIHHIVQLNAFETFPLSIPLLARASKAFGCFSGGLHDSLVQSPGRKEGTTLLNDLLEKI